MSIKKIFLGWHEKVVELVGKQLAEQWHNGIPDMSHLMIVVPTRQSGRCLHEGLTQLAAEKNMGILPPKTVTPDFFLMPTNLQMPLASTAESVAVWIQVLTTCNLDDFKNLFPVKPESSKDPQWVLGVVEQITSLRNTLNENGLLIRDVAGDKEHIIEEPQRWDDLIRLERMYLEKLDEFNLADSFVAKIENSRNPELPEGVEKIILCAVPDPTPLALRAIESLSKTVPVEIWIHAPEELKDKFDEWGRPVAAEWENEYIDFPDEDCIRLCGDAAPQADEVVRILADIKGPLDVSSFAVAAPNESLYPFIDESFDTHGIDVYNPAGVPISGSAVFSIINTILDCVNTGSYEAFSALLRNSVFLHYLCATHEDFDCSRLLEQVDRFQNEHLPRNLENIRYFLSQKRNEDYAELKKAVSNVEECIELFSSSQPLAFIREFLIRIYKDCEIDPSDEDPACRLKVADQISDVLTEMETSLFDNLELPPGMVMEILLSVLEHKAVYLEQPEQSVPVRGWLEMHWENADTIIITGMNEGYVPDSIVSDIFLPDTARERLGLKTNRMRFARDIYLMSAMIRSRPQGKVYCITGKTDVNGEPLKPSRLLFQCPDAQLPARARRLFEDIDEQQDIITVEQQLKLKPDRGPIPDRMSVTWFRDYLQCPFRFYLNRVLEMEACDDRKREADALDFGIACHHVLELMGKKDNLKECTDQNILAHFLQDEVEKYIKQKFGPDLPLTLMVQLESLKERLAKAAEVEIAQRMDGWKSLAHEYKLGNGRGVEFNGMVIKGKIDRIDIRDDMIRILDYKTSDTVTKPLEAHLKSASDTSPDWACLDVGGKRKTWIDLQLPLYRSLLRRDPKYKDYNVIQCGYFVMPKAVTETGIYLWEELDDVMLSAAESCAEAVINNIRNLAFWPPVEEVKYDDFENLFITTMSEAIDSKYFLRALADE